MAGILVAWNVDFRCFQIIYILSESRVNLVIDIDLIESCSYNLTTICVDGLVAHVFYYSY